MGAAPMGGACHQPTSCGGAAAGCRWTERSRASTSATEACTVEGAGHKNDTGHAPSKLTGKAQPGWPAGPQENCSQRTIKDAISGISIAACAAAAAGLSSG